MADPSPPRPPGHPSPQAQRLSVLSLMTALIGAPLAWSLQISAGYAAAAYACYPRRDALAAPVLPHLHLALSLLSVGAMLIAVLSGLLAWRNWRLTRGEVEGDHHVLLEQGEGRSRFMSLCALISSIGFGLALLLTSTVLFLVAPCGL